MEIIAIVWIIIIVLNVVKAKKKTDQAGSRDVYGRSVRDIRQNIYEPRKNVRQRSSNTVGAATGKAVGKVKESWRNTAEVTRSDITFRGLREGEDELAYLIERNTAYEKILEKRLVSRDH